MDADLKKLLGWLDFTLEESEPLESEGFTDFEDFVSTTKDELKYMIDVFYKRDDLAFTIPNKRPNKRNTMITETDEPLFVFNLFGPIKQVTF